MYMKNYLKPYTECTKVESEGYLLAGGSKDTPGAGNDGFTHGGNNQGGGNKDGDGCGSCNNTKTPSKSAPKSVTNGFFYNSDGE